MVWHVLSDYARRSGVGIRVDPETAYALFDGLFTHAVRDWLAR